MPEDFYHEDYDDDEELFPTESEELDAEGGFEESQGPPSRWDTAKKWAVKGGALITLLAVFYLFGGLREALFYARTPEAEVEVPVSAELDAEEIVVPLQVFVFRNDGSLGSERTEDNIFLLVRNAEKIWRQANIGFEVERLERVVADDVRIRKFFADPASFLASFSSYDGKKINIFLARSIGGPNGIAFVGLSSVAVADLTSVFDFRALAHEIGHVLGLSHHAAESDGRLMFPGANGSELTLLEAMTARERALQFSLD